MANQSTYLARSSPGLPKDVVRETFALFAGTTLATSKPREYPWFLGHICSAWRSVFLSMSVELWSSISISFDRERNGRHKDIVRFFLERDPTAPFSLNVHFPRTTASERQEDHMFHALEMLVNASERWKNVSIKAKLRDLLPLTRTKNRLPLLQRFKLLSHSEAYPLFDIFQNTPSLTTIDVYELAGWEFNWANLKAITANSLGSGASNFIAALPQLTKLEQLIIAETFLLPSSIIILPNLIKLDCDLRLLSFLEAPLLQDLSIDCYHYSSDDKIVQSFLRRSSCTMNISSLGIRNTEAVAAIEIIKLTPHIVHLKLVFVYNSGTVYEQLTMSAKPAQEWLACHMQSLSIHDTYYDTYDDLLFDLVSSRTINSAAGNHGYERLQKLVQDSCDSTAALIALCKERGVQYTLMSDDDDDDDDDDFYQQDTI